MRRVAVASSIGVLGTALTTGCGLLVGLDDHQLAPADGGGGVDGGSIESGPAADATAPGKSVTVTSIADLKTSLRDDTLDEIVVQNGTYHVSPSNQLANDSLWIDLAARTRPIVVRAATPGGVTFDGAGTASGYGGLSFEDGAHDQTWDGFRFANMLASASSIIEIGGYDPRRPPHHITLRNITIEGTCHRNGTASTGEQAMNFATSAGAGPHDILAEDITIDGSGALGMWAGIHSFSGDAAHVPSSNVVVRRVKITGTTVGIILWWTVPNHDWLIEGATISNAADFAIRFEGAGQTNIVFKDVVSTGSGKAGFYSSTPSPPGVTTVNSSLN